MSLTRSTLLQQASAESFGTGSFTPAAFTPSNNSLLIVVVRATAESNDGTSGADLTMTPSAGTNSTPRVNTTTSPSWSYGLRVWTVEIGTGASMTVQVGSGGKNIHQYKVEVYQELGYNTSTPTGATATGTDADGDGAAAITLSGAPAIDSDVFAFAETTLTATGSPATTEGTGWTELYDTFTDSWSISQTEVRTASVSTSVDWNDLSSSGGITAGSALAALEIKAAAGGGAAQLGKPWQSQGGMGVMVSM